MGKIRKMGQKMLNKKDKPRAEFKSKAAEIIGWCSDAELNLLRVKINAEIQFRIDHWGKIADKSIKTGGKTVEDKRAKYRKRLEHLNECNRINKLKSPIGNANN